MFKYLLLLERHAGAEHDNFVRLVQTDYLAAQKACLPYVQTRRSNFVRANASAQAAHIADIPPPPSYHAILENWVEDSDVARLRRDLSDRQVQMRLRSATGDWLRTEGSRAVAVVQHETAAGNLGSAHSARDDGSMLQQIANIKKLPLMSYEEFVKYYEGHHAPLAARLLPTFAKYVRNFVVPDSALQAELNMGTAVRHDFDVMTQMWFSDAAAYREFGLAFKNPEIARAFAEDEAKLFDRKSIQLISVDGRVN